MVKGLAELNEAMSYAVQGHPRWTGLREEFWQNMVFGRKAMTNIDSHLFATKGPYSQNYGFSSSHVWIWEVDHKEGWALKNWCFQIMVLEKTLRVPWTARRSNQSILKEINPEYSLEGMMLKLQYFGYHLFGKELTHWKRPWCWERLKAKGWEGGRGWDG